MECKLDTGFSSTVSDEGAVAVSGNLSIGDQEWRAHDIKIGSYEYPDSLLTLVDLARLTCAGRR